MLLHKPPTMLLQNPPTMRQKPSRTARCLTRRQNPSRRARCLIRHRRRLAECPTPQIGSPGTVQSPMMYNPSATTTIVSAEVASAAHARTHTAAGGELYAPTGTKGMMEPHNGEWSTQWAHERITQWQKRAGSSHRGERAGSAHRLSSRWQPLLGAAGGCRREAGIGMIDVAKGSVERCSVSQSVKVHGPAPRSMLAEHVNRPQFNYVVSSHVPNSVDRSPGPTATTRKHDTRSTVRSFSLRPPRGSSKPCVVLGLGLKVVPLQV